MKIVGIGVDIIQNDRIKSSIKNKNFIHRTFSQKEIFISKKKNCKIKYFSKRFVAKEAFAKALGTGFRDGLNFRDIQILNDKQGKPYYFINSKIKNLIKKKKRLKNLNCFFQLLTKKNIQ